MATLADHPQVSGTPLLEARDLERAFGGGAAAVSGSIDGSRYDDLSDRELTKLRGEVLGFVFPVSAHL